MLNIRKINHKQIIKSQIQTEQSRLTNQKQVNQGLNEILSEKPFSYQKLHKYLLQEQSSSVSGQQFVKIISHLLQKQNLKPNTVNITRQILLTLAIIPHDAKEVKSILKRQKKLDIFLLMSLVWQKRQNQHVWKYIVYLTSTYPTEIMLNGKPYLQKWQEYFQNYNKKIEQEQQAINLFHQQKLKEKMINKILASRPKDFQTKQILL